MNDAKRYYRTTYKIEVLSDEPVPAELDMDAVIEATVQGPYVLGNFHEWPAREVEELSAEEMRAALVESCSDPDFFDPGGDDD